MTTTPSNGKNKSAATTMVETWPIQNTSQKQSNTVINSSTLPITTPSIHSAISLSLNWSTLLAWIIYLSWQVAAMLSSSFVLVMLGAIIVSVCNPRLLTLLLGICVKEPLLPAPSWKSKKDSTLPQPWHLWSLIMFVRPSPFLTKGSTSTSLIWAKMQSCQPST